MFSDYTTAFKNWCRLKIKLWNRPKTTVFKQGDIWWCSLGMNLGEEIFGKGEKLTRPVLIFRKFTSNSFLGLPLTTQEKQGSWYVETELKGVKRWAMLNQARILDKKRLTSRVGALDNGQLNRVKRHFLELYSS